MEDLGGQATASGAHSGVLGEGWVRCDKPGAAQMVKGLCNIRKAPGLIPSTV